MRHVTQLLVTLATLFTASCLRADEPISIQSLLNEVIDRDAVARFPATGFRLKQNSSYNRASKTPEDANGWFNNKDNNTDQDLHNGGLPSGQ